MAFQEGDIDVTLPDLGYIALAHALEQYVAGSHVVSVAINAAGAGYVVGDILTVAGGTKTRAIFTATIEVTAVGGGGAITAARLVNAGSFSADPTTAANAVTGGTGTGATFDLTMEAATWTIDRTTYVNDQTEFNTILHGSNPTGASPYIGIGTFTANGIRFWQLRGYTGFNNSLTWAQQPGASPGFEFGAAPSSASLLPLTDADIHFYFWVSKRRIIVVARMAPSYEMAYLGLVSAFVDDELVWPQPILVAGMTSSTSVSAATARNEQHSCVLHHPTLTADAYKLRWIDGTWITFVNVGGFNKPVALWPFVNILANTEADAPNKDTGSGVVAPEGGIISNAWFSGDQLTRFAPGPFGIGSRTFPLLPWILFKDEPGATQVLGELEGIVAIPGRGIAAEERVLGNDGQVYVVLPDANSNALNHFYAVREA